MHTVPSGRSGWMPMPSTLTHQAGPYEPMLNQPHTQATPGSLVHTSSVGSPGAGNTGIGVIGGYAWISKPGGGGYAVGRGFPACAVFATANRIMPVTIKNS